MLRYVVNPRAQYIQSALRISSFVKRPFTTPKGATPSEQDIAAARKWLAKFDAETIPKSICEVDFSRSSGPGGQNVNKVNSKATLRVPLSSLLPHIPPLLHQLVRNSPYYAKNSDSLLIQASDSRKQRDNLHACYVKLDQVVLDGAAKLLPGETSEAQRERVKNLQKADNERRIKMKKVHGSKKSSRRGDWD
ncbi:peptidyl-tRNA hydrolase domain-containing protein [Rhizodiscina lignyota]|uniref:Peptidyl-tRNA hydrolase domain-containing protein n=1 Tax=Rhizodiscina lignyota TaxID=1504668 RepID=A0A9P4M347_9PEZI|nr:peptidyl-tRNA hydrolase domain-containing protein [Rhizodiscina lignyota]